MPPRYRTTPRKIEWWDNAYKFHDDITAIYELKWNSRLILPGELIKFKHQRGKVYKFRCIAHNIKLDRTWIDCLDKEGQYRSFEIEDLAGPLPKRRKRSYKGE